MSTPAAITMTVRMRSVPADRSRYHLVALRLIEIVNHNDGRRVSAAVNRAQQPKNTAPMKSGYRSILCFYVKMRRSDTGREPSCSNNRRKPGGTAKFGGKLPFRSDETRATHSNNITAFLLHPRCYMSVFLQQMT